jgi:AraC family transcriptional regulator of adaptative response/methylated-DNA-[protein]-cysteine methyltransferase
MMNETLIEQSENYKRVEQAIRYLEDNFKRQPSLEEVAESVNLSKFHFQRTFKNWAGVSPSQFLRYLTVEYAKERLKDSRSIFETTMDAGLSSPSRLHDLFITYEAMTPGEYKRSGSDLEIRYGFHPTPFGMSLLALTERGICGLRFMNSEDHEAAIGEFKNDWPQARFIEDPPKTGKVIQRLFSTIRPDESHPFHLVLKGTNFQVKVWQALLAVSPGSMVSYQDIAGALSKPGAARAVANAVSKNPVAYFIPCHRVISKAGHSLGYRWGTARKKAILGWEAARLTATGGLAG